MIYYWYITDILLIQKEIQKLNTSKNQEINVSDVQTSEFQKLKVENVINSKKTPIALLKEIKYSKRKRKRKQKKKKTRKYQKFKNPKTKNTNLLN